MEEKYLQNWRYKLQKRVSRLNSVDWNLFHSALKQFWKFLHSVNIYKAVVEDLLPTIPDLDKTVKEIISRKPLLGDTEEESAAIGYKVMEHCVNQENARTEQSIGRIYTHSTHYADHVNAFFQLFVEPFYEYLDEHLDDQRAVLYFLKKYKERCEWFRPLELYNLWNEDTQKGERSLCFDLYEYLHGQGLEFSIEPWSASGEADLVSSQVGEERLVADGKIFNPAKNKTVSYVASAFAQIYRYTCDYNEPFGYLIIYKTCEEDLNLTFGSQGSLFPELMYNNKTIFFVVIDIFPHEKPASQRGPLKKIDVQRDDILKEAAKAKNQHI